MQELEGEDQKATRDQAMTSHLIFSTSSDESSSDESELRNLDEKYNKRNPFMVPKIVVQPNSPIPGHQQEPAQHAAQTVPLGPTPFGTALYQPSLPSLMKYQ